MISAGYTTKCPGCGEQIEEGDAIGLVDGDWCCEGCVDSHGEDDREGRRMTHEAGEQVGRMEFPPEWVLGHCWLEHHVLCTQKLKRGTAIAMLGYLSDGSNILGLTHPGGQRLARISPHTDYALEERFAGTRLAEVDKLWRVLLNALRDGFKRTEAELGPPPGRTS